MAIGKKIIETLCPSCGFRCHAPVLYIGKAILCPRCRHTFEAVKFSYSSLLKHFIRIALGNFLITEQKLAEIVSAQKAARESGKTSPLEDLLIDTGLITIDQKNRLMASSLRKLNRMFVALAVEKNRISLSQGAEALDRQAADFKKDQLTLVCDILLEKGSLTLETQEAIIQEIESGETEEIKGRAQVMADRTGKYPLMGKVALEKELVTLPDLEQALVVKNEHERAGRSLSLEEILHETGVISEEMKQKLVLKTLKRIDKELARIALSEGLVTKERMVEAAGKQAALFKQFHYFPLFHILLKEGAMTRQGVEQTWSRFQEIERDEAEDLVKKGTTILRHIAQIRRGTAPPPSSRDLKSLAPQETLEEDEAHGPEILLTVSEDALSASISLSPAVGEEAVESAEAFLQDIKAILDEKGVVFGVYNDEILKACVTSSMTTHQPFIAAQGEALKEGRPAEIIYYFQIEYLRAGAITEEGLIDFRERGDVPFVKQGDLLCLLIPAVPGKNGIDIHGNPLWAKEIEDRPLVCGSGVFLSEDGLKLFAGANGRPEKAIDGKISVFPELTIPGDVDFGTGHITFDGNIHIKGAICKGFKVKGVNLTAKEILGGVVDVTGSVDVRGGIVDSEIMADGYVQAIYIQGTTVRAFGDLLIVKEIIDSDVQLSGMLKCDRCKIISSSISARMGMEVSQIGTEVSTPCRIRVGVDDHMNGIIRAKEDQMNSMRDRVEKVQKKVETIREELGRLHQKIMEESIYQESLDADAKRLNRKLGQPPSSGLLRKIKSAEASIKKALGKSQETISALFIEQERALDTILAGIGSVEEGIHAIESLSGLIRSIKQKQSESQGEAKALIKNKLFAKTRISGKHAALTVADDLKKVIIREVRRPSPEGDPRPRWEMEVIRAP